MVYQEHGMWEVLEVLRRGHQGQSLRAIAAATGRSRKTVRRYLTVAQSVGWRPEQEPDEALACRVLERVRPGPRGTAPGEIERWLLAHADQIRNWLGGEEGRRGLTLTKVQRLLARQGVVVPYSSLHRFAVQRCAFGRKRLTVRVAETAPGELAEVDFGRLGPVWDPQAQRHRTAYALIVTLAYSRHQYVHITACQKLPELLDGLENAWEFFGGVTVRLVLDNLKAAVSRADRYDPIFQRTFQEYARHRGFVLDPTAPRDPTGKPHVERTVPYVRENFFRGEQWLDFAQVQREALAWCVQQAGTRRHGTTGQRPLVAFEEQEKSVLRPLAGGRFDTPHWGQCKVHPDHHIQFSNALYSVPTRYLGQTVTVRGDRSLVRIYAQGQLIKTHPVQLPGHRSTDYEDYPDSLAPYARRDPDRLIREGRQQGEHIGRFLSALLAGAFPWAHLRQAQKLLRLSQKYGGHRVDQACQRALAFDLLNVHRVERIVLHGLAPTSRIVPRPARFLRPAGSFTYSPIASKENPHGDPSVPQDRAQEAAPLGPAADPARPGGVCPQDPAAPGGLPRTRPAGRD